MSKIQVQIDVRNIVNEIEKLIDLHYKEAKEKRFAESYPELYWGIYIPAKTALKRWERKGW